MKLTQAQLAHIKGLENRKGQITARRVLEDAKRKQSPLHALFNWDLQHAAERWWLHRARLIIGAVTIQVTHQDTVIKSPCYIVDTSVKGGGYRTTVSMKTDTASARESLVYTLEVAAGHLRRAYDLAAPLGLSREIDALLAQIAGVARIAEKQKAA
tara:strand:- start:277 stop:744 length:468 start_codon:yes stop_codon:yes gene_type:complete